MLDDVGESLVALASFAGKVEQVLELGGLHILRATANFIGKNLPSTLHWSRGQEMSTPTWVPWF